MSEISEIAVVGKTKGEKYVYAIKTQVERSSKRFDSVHPLGLH
jgi:hypothetical protein